MKDVMVRVVARVMNRVRLNDVTVLTRADAAVVLKKRRRFAAPVIWCANRFLALAGSGARLFPLADDWTRWEAHCAGLLYPQSAPVTIGPGAAVTIPAVAGTSLRTLLGVDAHRDTQALTCAGREVRRAHHLHCRVFNAAWSHGDLHLDNILIDLSRDAAFLIDFDYHHTYDAAPLQRHAEDVMVVLLDLAALRHAESGRWATTFLESYDDPAVCAEVERLLVEPSGWARVLWYVRTRGLPPRPLVDDLKSLVRASIAG